MSVRFLAKSRFKIGHECPTKFYFLDDKRIGNANEENAFLQALAEDGFLIGELAKLYYAVGQEVDTLDKLEAFSLTCELLNSMSLDAKFLSLT